MRVRCLEASERTEVARCLTLGEAPVSASQIEQFIRTAERMGPDGGLMLGGDGPDGRLRDVVMLIPQPGRTAMLFLSRPTGPGSVDDVARLVEEACRRTPSERAALVQALLPPHEELERAALRGAGFRDLTTLCYMQARLPRRATGVDLPAGVTLEPWAERRRGAFLAALEASYEQTLDCPGLRDVRRTEDVLAGHRATGRFEPALWTLLRVGDEPAAVMLLNPAPAAHCVELVYLGVSAAHRHRGLGSALLRHGVRQCAQRGHRRLTLAVDEQNEPAMKLYRRFGFRRLTRRAVLIRELGDAAR